ncbi:response regulator transcription factor [Nostoc flagelliforme FACHB-838]|uniref:Response regulator transcription factor n=1 Tax=Nostoc flagelliforme FACHB-838 TaxID=2692904 RepID=A0ABR8DJ22_9NOSO|nr:response regulator transcription factor [Nostoc flagelliforme]MBD2528956.1 response regulator transcription factor [Nostoc flagelliforme FACHB-838]
MNQILIAEDEPRIAAFIEKGLRSHGFTTAVAADAYSATNMALSSGFDLMILDLGLPGKDGLDVLEELRGQGEILPVIILTARHDIQDKVAGFEAGADDYVTKPFRFEELLVRVKARLRHSGGRQAMEQMVIKAGNVVLDLRSRKVKVGQNTVELPAREFTLAETFFRHPGQVLSREKLLDRVWGYDYDPGSMVLSPASCAPYSSNSLPSR